MALTGLTAKLVSALPIFSSCILVYRMDEKPYYAARVALCYWPSPFLLTGPFELLSYDDGARSAGKTSI